MFVLAAVTVTFAALALRLPEAVPLVPPTTLPRAKVDGLAVNWPAAAVPVPDTGMVNVGLEAFEVIVRLPLALLADCGVKLTLKLALCPGVSVTGVVMPRSVKPIPLIPT